MVYSAFCAGKRWGRPWSRYYLLNASRTVVVAQVMRPRADTLRRTLMPNIAAVVAPDRGAAPTWRGGKEVGLDIEPRSVAASECTEGR